MNIAELFVRVRGDTTDVNRKMKDVEGSIAGVGKAAGAVPLPMTRMNGALRVLAQQATGTSGPVGSLLTTIGSFAVGGPYVAAALIGLAAVAKAQQLVGRTAKEAEDAQRKLTDSFLSAFKPAANLNEGFKSALKERVELTRQVALLESQGAGTVTGDPFGILKGKMDAALARIKEISDSIAEAQTKSISKLDTVHIKTERVATATEKVAKATKQIMLDWGAASSFVETFEKGTLAAAVAMTAPEVNMNTVGGVDIDTGEWKKIQDDAAAEQIRASERNAQTITNAVLQSANIIVGALNIGGGGKGSSLGGALGSTAGFAAGMFFTGGNPIGGAIGSTLGNIAGSLLGGLFDSNKEAINRNTEATRALTTAMLLHAPSGYKVASGRFDATEIKEIRDAAIRFRGRGGAPVFAAT